MYDPMIGKLIVWDADREQATRRMLRALDEYEIEGLKTLIPFHKALLATEQWARGETCRDLLERHAVSTRDVVLIAHQANRRIITATAERLGLRDDQVVINIDRYGNTTAATIPLATRDAISSGVLVKGKTVLFAAVGAGMTVGANLWRWEY